MQSLSYCIELHDIIILLYKKAGVIYLFHFVVDHYAINFYSRYSKILIIRSWAIGRGGDISLSTSPLERAFPSGL